MQIEEEEVGDDKRHSSRDPQNFPLRSKGVEGQAAGELSWREALKLAQMRVKRNWMCFPGFVSQ